MSDTNLEKYLTAKPRTSQIPGYFDDAGKFTHGPFYIAHLGKQSVAMPDMPGYLKEAGAYQWREAALAAAKAFQAKCRELLAERAAATLTNTGESNGTGTG